MTIPKSARTHLIYQFIILTLLFLCMGYYELSTERKFIVFLAFIPMFLCQFVILSFCIELLPVPGWMVFCDVKSKESIVPTGAAENQSPPPAFRERVEVCSGGKPRPRRTKLNRLRTSFTDLGSRPENHSQHPQKSASWIDLSGAEGQAVRADETQHSSSVNAADTKKRIVPRKGLLSELRQERNLKARSWMSKEDSEPESKIRPLSLKKLKCMPKQTERLIETEEKEIEKSYSFPFRQKRLEKWMEMKENPPKALKADQDKPYWQTVGYDLAVKYEARRRKRAFSGPTEDGKDITNDIQRHFTKKDLSKSTENNTFPTRINMAALNKKFLYRSTAARLNKIKSSLTNLISRNKKDGGSDNGKNSSQNCEKYDSKSVGAGEENCLSKIPLLPKFLSNDRPFVFYPKYIPFEKDRFESDVKKKMLEFNKS